MLDKSYNINMVCDSASYVLILFIRYHKLKIKQNGYRGGDYYEC